MVEEYLKIVDDKNIPTGKDVQRSVAHQTGLRHRVVYIYFFRRVGNTLESLVNLRSATKDTHPNMYAPWLGGHVRSGKSEEETAEEELKEEVGLSIDTRDLIDGGWRKKEDPPLNKEFIKIYYYEFTGNIDTLVFRDKEVQSVKWMNVPDIENAMRKNPKQWVDSLDDFKMTLTALKSVF